MSAVRPAIDAAVRAAVRKSTRFNSTLPQQLTRSIWAAAFVLGMGATAHAQQKPADETPAAGGGGLATLEEITVTGSRIKRTNDFNTPTPTTVIDTTAMESVGVVNIGQTLQLSPANASTFTPANTGNSNFFTGAYIPDLRGLNPYFGSRTLTLVDGQRFVQTEQGDQIDLNFMPQIMVQRIDVVTGGASAAYGSGAIAGVENIILDNKLEGGKLNGDFFQTSHSDARDHHFGAAYGHSLFDGKFHFTIGGEVERQDQLGCENVRVWCSQNNGVYQAPNPYAGQTFAPGYTPPTYWALGSGLHNFSSPYGVFVSGLGPPGYPTSTYQGNTTGTGVNPFAVPQPYAGAPAGFIATLPGGDGTPLYASGIATNLMSQLSRGVVMGLFDGEIIDGIHWKSSIYYGKVSSNNIEAGSGTTFAFNNCNQDAYTALSVSPSLNAACNAQALFPGTAAFNKDWTSQMPGDTEFDTRVTRATFGLNGKFGSSTWTWDANYEYGLTHHNQNVYNNIHNYAMSMALDTVLVNGQPQCRVTAAGGLSGVLDPANPYFSPGAAYATANPLIANGCVPINPFGNQPLTAAQRAYAFGSLVEQLRYEQTDFNVNTSGDYFDGIGAGPWSLAVGYEFRQEVGKNIDQPGVAPYTASDYPTQYGQSFGGTVSVNEAYLETNIPLIKDAPGAHLLTLDLSGREARYQNRLQFTGIDTFSNFVGQDFNHNLTTWKASLIYEPVEGVRLRATQSRDSRAANFRELYYSQVISAGGLFGYCYTPGNNNNRNDPCNWNLLGNPNLRPETSDTTTFGLVLTPTALPGFSFSADYFHIKIKNAIEQANPTILQDSCGYGVQSACNQMTLYNPGTTTVATTPAQIAAAQSYYQQCWTGTGIAATTPCSGLNVQSISPTSYNGAYYLVEGIDFSIQDTLDLGKLGNLTTRLLTTFTDQQKYASCSGSYQLGCYTYSILGQTGTGNTFLNDYTPTARWRGVLMTTWSQGGLSITPQMNFVSNGVMDYSGVTPASGPIFQEVLTGVGLPANLKYYGLHPMQKNYVPSYFLFNLNGTYSFREGPANGLSLFVQVNNVFNKQPPVTGGATQFGSGNNNGGTNPIFFDTLGLAYRIGFRYTF
jgi:iron complex outermembrane recepter protein